ncbi:hypothetical protein [Umezawaea tangerina]|uniref:Uncharacterized protein n=1 Tax=Umezawaea tangerina TaxID=84725 RepID=A0A2T0SGP8_9PSEU|nr:hypothetical protein [Umezawaea tangerina]PRY32591.1 hypothetical protein CLV43_12010 [Umezawaea tangerina]
MLELVRELDLDPDHFVIFGSAPLFVQDLRDDIQDLDVLARGSAWEKVTSSGGAKATGTETGDVVWQFHGGRIQFSQQWISADFDTDALIDGAKLVDNLRFAQLDEVLRYKELLGRSKDHDDIAALREHLRLTPALAGAT